MKIQKSQIPTTAFTLVEMLIVLTVISILSALTMGAYTYAMRGSKEKTTRGTFEAIVSALDNYNTDFGEYPEPANQDQMVEILPGKLYNAGGAACLYQALSGDGFDQIAGVSAAASSGGGSSGSSGGASSNGKTEGEEIAAMKLKEMPQTMWAVRSGMYIVIDGFGRPFQYTKAVVNTDPSAQPVTINSTYDLWSYAQDEININKKSVDTVEDTSIALKWVKNW